MKILVVDIAASTGGALSVLKDFYEETKKDKNNEYIFLLSDNYLKETSNIKTIILKNEKKWIKRLIFDHINGKKIVKKLNPDVILSFQNTIIRGVKQKQILYVHQSIPFQKLKKFSFFKKNEFKLAIIQYFIGNQIKKSIKLADKVIVQSEWMKEAITKECKIEKNKIKKITPKIEDIKLKKIKLDNTTFFYPASNAIYKNHSIINEAVEILRNQGIKNFKVEFTLEGENTNQIKYLGTLSRDKVFDKYQSSILIFPSYIETYGLPLAEAKKTQTIILAADTEFSKEILSDYPNAYFFNPFDSNELTNLMEQCINKKIIKKSYKDTTKQKNVCSKLTDIIKGETI